jgi:hypothetical protein
MFFFKCSFWTIYFKGHKEAFSQTFQIPHHFNILQEYLVLMISANSEMTTYLLFPLFWTRLLVTVPIILDLVVGYCSQYFGPGC